MPILLTALDSVQVNNLKAADDLGQVGSVLNTSIDSYQCYLKNLQMGAEMTRTLNCLL